MSRIVVKNLPKRVTDNRLRGAFSKKGEITDLQLKYTKDGRFRQFAFIGYKTNEEAQAAKDYFDNTYFDTSKIHVEICTNLGDPNKPKSWSKYSKDSSAYQKKFGIKNKKSEEENTESKKTVKKEKKAKSKFQEILEEAEKDKEFKEFLELHKSRANKPVWSNDTKDTLVSNISSDGMKDKTNYESGEESEELTSDEEEKKEMKTNEVQNMEKEEKINEKEDQKKWDNEFTVKLSGLPYKCKKKDIRDFFGNLKLISLRKPQKYKGVAYVRLASQKEVKQALNKHKSFMSGNRINVRKCEDKNKSENNETNEKRNTCTPADEEIGESGRIFIRNLVYSVTEEEIESLFKKYGPLTEVNLPVDRITRKIKGFAFVTFMLPEHAVKAFTELDGSSFQGRTLHILPAAQQKTKQGKQETGSYKDKKLAQLKELCGSSHNWNTLFLGANAVADVMAKKYKTEKSELLNARRKDSMAVRMALGETEIVVETRQFLLHSGVELDSFSQSAAERSKNVILVKNLPAKTDPESIKEIFSKFGAINRVILPPSGITAIIEFEAASEARNAFNKLAYSRFKHVPLYLEWAPGNIFHELPSVATKNVEESVTKMEDGNENVPEDEKANKNKSKSDEQDDSDDEEPEENTILFIKNLNFETTEEDLRKHFKKIGPVHSVTIAKKKNIKNPGSMLSMGYGFVQYKHRKSAQTALKELQHSILDQHSLELKLSNRATEPKTTQRKKTKVKKQKTSKILIRNIPFEANVKEVTELFNVFGELKSVRLPKKFGGTESHRGFGFVDFVTKKDAKHAFSALCHSTHLYGRRLVLEWADTNDTDVATLRKKTADNFFEGPSKKRLKESLKEELVGIQQ